MSAVHSIAHDIEQQLTRCYALVVAARDALLDAGVDPSSRAATLLDFAEDELADVRLVRRLAAHEAAQCSKPRLPPRG